MEVEVIDQPVDEEVIDQPTESTEEEVGQPEEQISTETPEEKVDGRKFNPEWSKSLKELRELYPDRADMLNKLRDGYARSQAYLELDPKGMDTFKSWKTTIDALGGAEAAAQLMEQAAQVEQMDARIAAGDFSVVNELPEEMQKGFYQMLPDALNHIASTDQQRFAEMVQPHFAAALANTGLGDHMKRMYAAAEGNPGLQDMIRQQYEWFEQQTKGGKMPTGNAKSPEVERLQQELEKRNQADHESFANSVSDQANRYMNEVFSKEMAAYKGLGLNEKQTSDLMASVNAKVAAALGANAAFQNQLRAFKAMKNRNPEAVVNFVKSHVDAQAKIALDDLVSTRYGGMKAKPQRQAAPAQSAGGMVRVNQTPSQSDWDMEKMQAEGYENTAKKGIYYLKGGKAVQVVKA